MAKYKVRLTHTVELIVEGDSRDAIEEWLSENTPEDAKDLACDILTEDYEEEIVCEVSEDASVGYKIK